MKRRRLLWVFNAFEISFFVSVAKYFVREGRKTEIIVEMRELIVVGIVLETERTPIAEAFIKMLEIIRSRPEKRS